MKKITILLLFLSITSFSQLKQLDSFLSYEYDEDTSTWTESYKEEFNYNENHKNTDEYDYDNNNGVWELEYEVHYTYDENDNVIEVNGIEGTTPFKSTLSYDSNNNIIEELHFNWNDTSNQWENSRKNVNTYNANNKILESIDYSWNTTQWNNSSKDTYQYNSNDLLETYEYYYYDGSQWVLDSTKTYSYDSNNLLVEILSGNYKTEFIYDSNSLLIEELFSSLQTNTNTWIEEDKLVVTQYDGSIDFSHLILPYSLIPNGVDIDEDLLFFDKMVTEIKLSELDGTWSDYGRVDLFYSDVTASTNDISKEVLNIYPNPFTNEISFTLPTQKNMDLNLFDVQGKNIFNKTITSGEAIDLSTLESGVYFYDLIVDDKHIKGKIIKQ